MSEINKLVKRRILIVSAFVAVTVSTIVLFIPKVSRPCQTGRLKLPIGHTVPAVIFGSRYGAILASDGSLWAWGDISSGVPEMGLGNIKIQPSLRQIGNETNWTSLGSNSGFHTLAIKSDGTLWAWGNNTTHELGDGTKARFQSTPVPSIPGNDWKEAATGLGSSFAIKKDGSLWAWGLNNFGQLGIGTLRDSQKAVQVGTSTNWTIIRADSGQTAGIQSDGSLWVWGGDPALGFSERSKSTNHILVPTRWSPDTNWVDMDMSGSSAFAIKSGGTLWAWGKIVPNLTGSLNGRHYDRTTNHKWKATLRRRQQIKVTSNC